MHTLQCELYTEPGNSHSQYGTTKVHVRQKVGVLEWGGGLGILVVVHQSGDSERALSFRLRHLPEPIGQ